MTKLYQLTWPPICQGQRRVISTIYNIALSLEAEIEVQQTEIIFQTFNI